MKNIQYLLILFCFFIACKKDCHISNTSAIVGQWRWIKSTGGIGNIYQTPENSGYSWNIELNKNFTCYQSGVLFLNGNGWYTLSDDTNSGRKINHIAITVNNQTIDFNYFLISNDTLRLDNRIDTDGLSYFLVRK